MDKKSLVISFFIDNYVSKHIDRDWIKNYFYCNYEINTTKCKKVIYLSNCICAICKMVNGFGNEKDNKIFNDLVAGRFFRVK